MSPAKQSACVVLRRWPVTQLEEKPILATPDEIRAALAESRSALRDAIAGAGEAWEKKPEGGEGEDAWSPRQVAEHVIPLEARMTSMVCDTCGYPGVDPVEGNYPTVEAALASFDEVIAMDDKKLKYVSDTDLAKEHERLGSVETLMQRFLVGHQNEHAAQIRAASK